MILVAEDRLFICATLQNFVWLNYSRDFKQKMCRCRQITAVIELFQIFKPLLLMTPDWSAKILIAGTLKHYLLRKVAVILNLGATNHDCLKNKAPKMEWKINQYQTQIKKRTHEAKLGGLNFRT